MLTRKTTKDLQVIKDDLEMLAKMTSNILIDTQARQKLTRGELKNLLILDTTIVKGMNKVSKVIA